MYTCYLDGELLYHPDLDDYKIESTRLSTELNKTGSFKFTVRQQNPRYEFIKKKKSIVKIYNEDRRLFRGRVLNAKKGFYNQLQVTCEGEIAFFLDSIVRPYTFKGSVEEYFHFLVNSHNAQMDDEERKFKIGRCTVTDSNDYIVRESSDYPKTLDEMKEKLVKLLGGFLWTREEANGVYIDYLEDFETMNEQTVEFAKNLLDFEEVVKGQDIVTAIIPLGAKLTDEGGNETEERITIAGINDGIDYVYSPEAVEKYGFIFETVVWDDVTLPENLIRKGREELQNHINLTRTIELKAVDLHNLNLDIRSFYLGNYTSVISEPHDFDEMLLTRKLDINLLDPSDGFLVLGDEKITFVDKQVEASNKINQTIKTVEKITSDYEVNKENVEKRIESIENKLTLELTANNGTYQKIASDGTVSPDYTENPLILTPAVRFKNVYVDDNLRIIWKRKTGDAEESLADGETVTDGVLTVRRNLDMDSVRYICYATYTVSDNEKYVANGYLDFVRVRDGTDGMSGEDAVTIRIESSRGTVFKNDQVNTVLSVAIYKGSQRITDSETMKSVFGASAYLQWKWQRLDEDTFGVISASDSRFGDNGFTFTLSPEDVDTKVTFMCELIT